MKVYEQFKSEMAKSGLDVILELRAEQKMTSSTLQERMPGLLPDGPLVRWSRKHSLQQGAPGRRRRDVQQTLVGNQVVERLLYKDRRRARAAGFKDNPFTRARSFGVARVRVLDPEDIGEYKLHGGYRAAKKAYVEMTPEQICKLILDSGLRGRGGGGFPPEGSGGGANPEFSQEVRHLQRRRGDPEHS